MSASANSLLEEARAADRLGNTAQAIEIYQRIAVLYPQSDAAQAARAYLGGPRGMNSAPLIQRVTVVDLDISFGQLVALFVKASIAIIPAAIILAAIGFVLFLIVGALALRSGY